MNKKGIVVLLICAFTGGWNIIAAQNTLVVHPTNQDATRWEVTLSNIVNLTFTDMEVAFTCKPESDTRILSYTDIRKITFEEDPKNIKAFHPDISGLSLYPNPATDYLNVVGWENGQKADLTFYTISGQQFSTLKQWNGYPVSVFSLPAGLYILKINNQSFKFKKL